MARRRKASRNANARASAPPRRAVIDGAVGLGRVWRAGWGDTAAQQQHGQRDGRHGGRPTAPATALDSPADNPTTTDACSPITFEAGSGLPSTPKNGEARCIPAKMPPGASHPSFKTPDPRREFGGPGAPPLRVDAGHGLAAHHRRRPRRDHRRPLPRLRATPPANTVRTSSTTEAPTRARGNFGGGRHPREPRGRAAGRVVGCVGRVGRLRGARGSAASDAWVGCVGRVGRLSRTRGSAASTRAR
jgi:hypothetical protein